ncbi:MAG: 4-hydroxy-tetrahydrodipicolinate reductase [Bacteroidetes bacterium]|nr:4-hydroxy-tetrahydrodipicolinate reductase [Bacteroidota bacterium]
MKIALIGYGKMGKAIEEIALQKNHEVVLKVDEHFAGDILSELKKADVAIEFTSPDAAFGNIMKCFEATVPVVCGTTGWLDKMDEVVRTCKEKNQAFFYSSNYSIGVNIFFELNKNLAGMMNGHQQYDEVFIHEVHHVHKLDAPSGTAITLADQIMERIQRLKTRRNYSAQEKISTVKREDELAVFSSREGEVPGTHIVKYISGDDEIEIIHKAFNRRGFASGALLAAEWIVGKKGVYGMKDLLNL